MKGGTCSAFGSGRASGVLGALRLVRRLARQRPAHSSARPPMPPTTQAMMMPVRVDRPPLTGALASAPAPGRGCARSQSDPHTTACCPLCSNSTLQEEPLCRHEAHACMPLLHPEPLVRVALPGSSTPNMRYQGMRLWWDTLCWASVGRLRPPGKESFGTALRPQARRCRCRRWRRAGRASSPRGSQQPWTAAPRCSRPGHCAAGSPARARTAWRRPQQVRATGCDWRAAHQQHAVRDARADVVRDALNAGDRVRVKLQIDINGGGRRRRGAGLQQQPLRGGRLRRSGLSVRAWAAGEAGGAAGAVSGAGPAKCPAR